MNTALKCFVLLWLCAGIWVLSFQKIGVFYWIGISTMDVFNERIISALNYRIVFYRLDKEDAVRLPVVDAKGNFLSWAKNDGIKYQYLIPLSLGLAHRLKNQETSLIQFLDRNFKFASKPAILDFCLRDDVKTSYIARFIFKDKDLGGVEFELSDRSLEKSDPNLCRRIKSLQKYAFYFGPEDPIEIIPKEHFQNLAKMEPAHEKEN